AVEQVDQLLERRELLAVDDQRGVGLGGARRLLQLALDAVDHVAELRAALGRLGEAEPQQALARELVQGPQVRLHAVLPAAGVGHPRAAPALRRRPDPDAGERAGLQAEARVGL